MLNVVRKLVSGHFSLAMTFWGWGCGSALILELAMKQAIIDESVILFWSTLFLKLIIPSMVLSGIICHLHRRVTILRMMAAIPFVTYVLTVAMVIFAVIFAYSSHRWTI